MKRIVVIAEAGPGEGLGAGSPRVAQLARLYRRTAFPVDLVLHDRGGVTEGDYLAARVLFDRVGVIARGGLSDPEAGPRFLDQFALPDGRGLVHLVGAAGLDLLGDGAEGAAGGAIRVLDLASAAEAPQGGAPVDLVAATSDAALGGYLASRRGVRLPWRPPPMPRTALAVRRADPGTIGWVGVADGAGGAAGWRDLLSVLARRVGDWRGGVLLAGPWSRAVDVPEAMRGVRRLAEPGDAGAVLRALDLAVLPGPSTAGDDITVVAALRCGIPVLTLDATAALFGDRWRLARPGSIEDLADRLIARGPAAAAPDGTDLASALAGAQAEIERDGAAMEAHFLERLAALGLGR